MKRLLLLLLILSSTILSGFSQYFSTGQDPASIRWKQIRTEKYRIIFPENYKNQSQYLANILDLVTKADTSTLQSKVPRIPVLMHTRSAVSNGLTVWAPRRIELYSTPPQDSYAEEWLEQLAIHEYRHGVQVSKMNQGFTRVLYYLFGEQAPGGVAGAFLPTWFLEGDATVSETALSNSGRGRTAIFENVLRAQLLEKGIYSYDRAVLGSYRIFTPNAYQLGYPFVAQVRKKYGTKVWNTALDRTAKLPFMVVPFSSGIKKETGLTKVKLYKETMKDLQADWYQQDKQNTYTEFSAITRRDSRNFKRYIHPVFNNDTTIIAVKQSIEDVDWLVSINRFTGKETKLVAMGYGYDQSLSTSDHLVAWSEWEPHPRWQNGDYSAIRIYNLDKKKAYFLTHRTRYFAPSISPETERISAVRIDNLGNCFIDVLEAKTGNVLQKFPLPAGEFVMTPVWAPDGFHLIFTRLTATGKTISQIDTRDGQIKDFLPRGYTEISGPAYYKDQFIVFTADYSGIQDLYSMDTISDKIFRIISTPFSSSDPDFTIDRTKLTFLYYHSDGAMIGETDMDHLRWVPLEKIKDNSIKLHEAVAAQEKINVQDSSIKQNLYKILQGKLPGNPSDSIHAKIYDVKNYSKWLSLFNPHSWAPASIDVNNMTIKPGVSLLSQNILNTSFTILGYEYDVNEQVGKVFAEYSYRGWYPVFNFRFDYGERATYLPAHATERVRYTYNEMNFQANAGIPLNFSRGRHLRFFEPIIGTTYLQQTAGSKTPEGFRNHYYQTMDYRLYASETLISNPKDVYPRRGYVLDLYYRNTPFEEVNWSSILALNGNLYLPGFFRHHGFWFYAAYQDQIRKTTRSYIFSDLITYPRGISGADNETVYSFSANYKLPLLYPDLSIGPIFYIKRIKLNLFLDYAEGKNGTQSNFYRSTGAELTFDLHLLRFVYPFELGIRSIYLPDSKTWSFEFLYSVSI